MMDACPPPPAKESGGAATAATARRRRLPLGAWLVARCARRSRSDRLSISAARVGDGTEAEDVHDADRRRPVRRAHDDAGRRGAPSGLSGGASRGERRAGEPGPVPAGRPTFFEP